MKGEDYQQSELFSYISIEDRIPKNHPLREVKLMADFAIQRMQSKMKTLYSQTGRPSIAPEKLLRATILQFLYSIRSERQLMEQLDYNLLFRWFVGLNPDDPVWNHSVFSKNRDRFLKADLSRRFFREVVALARNHDLLSDEHFTVDGTLIESLASLKSFQLRTGKTNNKDDDPGNPNVDFHGEKRSNKTHISTTDPDALLFRKGRNKEAKLYYCASVLMENRNGLIVDCELSPAGGKTEREDTIKMLKRFRSKVPSRKLTLGCDKGYDTKEFVKNLRAMGITPHVARKKNSAIDGRTSWQPGYSISQRKRKLVEEIFGWQKSYGLMRKSRYIGRQMNSFIYAFSAGVYNLLRISNLMRYSYV